MNPSDSSSKDTQSLFVLLNEIGIINQLASTRFAHVLPAGLTLSQFSVLNNFVRLGGTRTPAQLAQAFQVTKGAMTNTLKRLHDKKCINIKADPEDGRSKLVSITPAGIRLRNKAVAAANEELDVIANLMDDDVLEVVLPKLQRLRAQLDRARE